MFTVITDPGVDDLVALTLLKKLSHDKNSLIGSFGNVSLKLTERYAREFLLLAASEWNYFKGSALPLSGKLQTPWAENFHGIDGVWGVHPDIEIKEVNQLDDYPENKEVISLGPLTDLFKLEEKINLEKVTIMGGAINVAGNETDYSEFNIAADPEGAANFFNNTKNTKINLVPLDVTGKVYWTKNQLENIPENNKVNVWLKNLLLTWYENYQCNGEKKFELYDPLAVYLHFFAEKAKWEKGKIKVILESEERGRTVLEKDDKGNCLVAVELFDIDKIQRDIFNILFN